MSAAQQAGSNEDEAAIRKVIVEMTEGFNNHDGKAAARMYSPDARFVSVRGDMMNGQAGIDEQGEERDAANHRCHGSIHTARCGARECNKRTERPDCSRRACLAFTSGAKPARLRQGRRRMADRGLPQYDDRPFLAAREMSSSACGTKGTLLSEYPRRAYARVGSGT
jgi:hypothetical protein